MNAEKEARRAAALRANLRKRKLQQRERGALAPTADGRAGSNNARPAPAVTDRKDP